MPLSATVLISSISTIPAVHQVISIIAELLFLFSANGVVLALFLFPDGRFMPRWMRVMVLPVIGIVILALLNIERIGQGTWTLIITVQSVLQLIGIAVQWWRYTHHSTPMQKQQTKWVILGYALAVGSSTLYFVVPLLIPSLTTVSFDQTLATYTVPSLLWMMIGVTIVIVGLSAVPITLAFSIVRYRLWQVDLTINRSLVSTLVAGILLVLFAGIFTAVQAALRGRRCWLVQRSTRRGYRCGAS
jgi:hypothetical protein